MGILSALNSFSLLQLQTLILVMCRVAGIFVDVPVFSNRTVPVMVKIGLMFFITFALMPLVKLPTATWTTDIGFVYAMIKEIAIGMILGYCARLIFVGIQIAGQFIDYQMGFGFVNIIDPESRLQIPIIGQFMYILVIFIFLLINGHHWILQSIVKSFQIVPLAHVHFQGVLTGHVVTLFSDTFVMGFKIAAPVAMSLFLVDLAYGVIARALPQANIMIIGFPVKIGLGFVFLMASMPLFFMVMKRFLASSLSDLNALFRMM